MLRVVVVLMIVGSYCSALKYKNCGRNEAVRINRLSLSPSTLKFPSRVKLDISGSINRPITGRLDLKVVMKRKILLWHDVPCSGGVGSCTYFNVCQKMQQINCPAGMQCRCPFKKGNVRFENYIDLPKLPSALRFFAKGTYRIRAKVMENGSEIGCVEVETKIG